VASKRKAVAEAKVPVATIELFFDLVFVFILTQLSHLVDQVQAPLEGLTVFLLLVLVWWIYAGYAWLTNATGAGGWMRAVLFAAMGGFMVIALALPHFFSAPSPAFGLAYLFVVLLHAGAFAAMAQTVNWQALGAILVINAGAAGLAIAAGLAAPEHRWAYLLGGAAMFVLSTLRRNEAGFSVQPGHFAERHGLVILIALGESVIGLGTGVMEGHVGLASLLLGLLFVCGLWWAYFGGDDAKAEHRLIEAKPRTRSRMALLGYWYAHLVMIAGIVLVAAGLRRAVGEGEGAPLLLAAGLSLYLLGGALFRGIMGLRPVLWRAIAAGAAWALAGLGPAGLAAGCALLVLLFSAESHWKLGAR
jgi:low temperature requirement protein LtrA